MKINIAICDDQKEFIQMLQSELKEIDILRSHTCNIHTFTAGKDLVEIMMNNTEFDIIFMDIELEPENILGTKIGTILKNSNPNTLLIYMSNFDSYFPELSKAEPFDFLSKPIKKEDLSYTLTRAIQRLFYLKHEFMYSFKFNGVTYTVDLKDILYFESNHRVVNIHCKDGIVYQFYDKLDNVEKDIENKYPFFARVTKSYYVNIKYVNRISNFEIKIGGLELKISPKYKLEFHSKMMSSLAND